MARNSKATQETNYKDFDITGSNNNDFKGRVWTEGKSSDKGTRYGLSITINGVSIKGAKLWVPSDETKDCSVLWPSYEDSKKKGEYHDYVGIFDKELIADLKDVCNKIAEKI